LLSAVDVVLCGSVSLKISVLEPIQTLLPLLKGREEIISSLSINTPFRLPRSSIKYPVSDLQILA